MTTRAASCNCGQLRVEGTGEPVHVSVCHCDECQRRTGSVFAVHARFPREAVHIKGEGKEFVRTNEWRCKVSVLVLCNVRFDGVLRRGKPRAARRDPGGRICRPSVSCAHGFSLWGKQTLLGCHVRRDGASIAGM